MSQSQQYPRVRLTQNISNKLREGHPWIYGEAIRHDPNLPAGEIVDVIDHEGEWLARGVFEPDSPLRVRVWTLQKQQPVDDELLAKRIKQALRRRPFPDHATTGFRLLNGEGDRTPGLTVDIYDKVAVLRFDGLAAERWLQGAQRTIGKLLRIRHWVIRRSEKYRGKNPAAMWLGTPHEGPVRFLENGLTFLCDPIQGQKTGFFLDQRANREHIAKLSTGRRVLNLFGYTGGFSLCAAAKGAASTTTVDLAKPALKMAKENFSENGISPNLHQFIATDVFKYLERFQPGKAPFEVVICDPPSFVHKRKDFTRGSKAYIKLFAQVLRVMPENSTIALASCSSHINREKFLALVAKSCVEANCSMVLNHVGGADVDHPLLPGFVEADYLQFCSGTLHRD